MKKAFLLFSILISVASQGRAQSKGAIQAYIETYKAIAIAEMQRTGVPAAITLAQGIHETGAGTSNLVVRSNNHFGIKCKSGWTGEKVYHDDDARDECFRKYDDPFISYQDHSDFLRARPHYASLFKLEATDYEAWAHGLKKAGYATNPKYPQILIKLIRDYNLQDYTLIALGKEPTTNQTDWASTTKREPDMVVEVQRASPTQPAYPQGEFEINDTKVIFIKKGTSYLKIADERDIPLARLLDFNDLEDGDVAPKDELLFLQRKRKTAETETHTVVEGEALRDIAQRYGIRLQSLLEYNFLTADARVKQDESLSLTRKATAAPRLTTDAPIVTKAVYTSSASQQGLAVSNKEQFHTVQPKETLFGIAKKYGVTMDELKAWNNMENGELKIGQGLRINKTN